MKKYLTILLFMLFASQVAHAHYYLEEYAPGYGKKVKIVFGEVTNKGWHRHYTNLTAHNQTDYDLMFIITYRICRVKLASRNDKLGDKYCSEVVTKYKYVPAHHYTRNLFNYMDPNDELPYLKSVGALKWGWDIIDFKVQRVGQ